MLTSALTGRASAAELYTDEQVVSAEFVHSVKTAALLANQKTCTHYLPISKPHGVCGKQREKGTGH